jgi:hypothetical protein
MSNLKSFEQLVEEKAGCFEFAWNGFVRLYEEGEKRCDCRECKLLEELDVKSNLKYSES